MNSIPLDYKLYDNYPNPFNPVSTIKFDIPKSTDVKMVIYNTIGQEIFTLINSHFEPGTYSVQWNGFDYPSEGCVVRRYRNPEDNGERECMYCNRKMHDHGWIDTLEGGHIVCPGDWIITGIAGERYPCKPRIFEASYEEAKEALK